MRVESRTRMRAPSWMLRLPLAVVISRSLRLSIFRFGAPQMGLFSRLEASARRRSWMLCSVLNVSAFETWAFSVNEPGPRNMTNHLPKFPWRDSCRTILPSGP